MHNSGYKSALARRVCRYSDARPPRKTDGILLESELPPHMRGKAQTCCLPYKPPGITPAYAGKSERSAGPSLWTQDHPRICGEKPNRLLWEHWKQGSPPRMRGKESVVLRRFRHHGITPAYAGKRRNGRVGKKSGQDHPRVCGEKTERSSGQKIWAGSPPRMRGKEPK